MARIDFRNLIIYFLVFVVIQIPLLYRFVFLDTAFGFFYVGFLLLLPFGLNPFGKLLIGFITGIIIDTFSNTPGLHAFACVFTMFIRDYWYLFVLGEPDDNQNISVFSLGWRNSVFAFMPLLFLHLLLVLGIEHAQISGFGGILEKSIWSSLFSLIVILVINFVIAKRTKRS